MNGLEKAQQRIREMREAGIEPERLDPMQKASRNPQSLRKAIDAKCWDCQGQDADPGVKWRVGNCQILDCPLHPVRPWRHLEGTAVPAALRTVA